VKLFFFSKTDFIREVFFLKKTKLQREYAIEVLVEIPAKHVETGGRVAPASSCFSSSGVMEGAADLTSPARLPAH